MRKSLAVIPARGGSKRLPRKNILPFQGKPLLAHTVEAALNSEIFAKVVFSSDDPEMLDVAAEYGAEPLTRPPELAGDKATLPPVVCHVLESFPSLETSSICLLMPNCPLRNAEDIRKSKQSFDNCGSDFQISVFKYHMFNPFWALAKTQEGLKPCFPEHFLLPKGGFDEVFCPSGAIWWAGTEAFLKTKDFYGPNLQPFVLPWFRAVDIDTKEDFEIAEIVAAQSHGLGSKPGGDRL